MSAPSGQLSAAPPIDVLIQSPLWEKEPAAEADVLEAIGAAAAQFSDAQGELSVVLTDDAAIRALNKQWRGMDKPTNVLSFPAPEHGEGDAPAMLGDIVIAYETLARECAEENKPFRHHLMHLAVHGFLHLMGYDHQSDSEAEEMEGLERSILASLRVPDPYADTHA